LKAVLQVFLHVLQQLGKRTLRQTTDLFVISVKENGHFALAKVANSVTVPDKLSRLFLFFISNYLFFVPVFPFLLYLWWVLLAFISVADRVYESLQ
jgi:hypothetical protein